MPNKVFPVENWKIEHHHLILYIWISPGTKFLLKLTILIFYPNLPKEYLVKIGKKLTTYESHISQIFRYQTSASRIKFVSNGYFQPKTEKVNSTTKFCLFKLVLLPNFSFNWQFWFSGANLPKKGISSLHQKKWTPRINSACWNQFT